MSGALQLHYSIKNQMVSFVLSEHTARVGAAYLSFEIDGGRADQIALIVCLLHRRRALVPHHWS